MKWKLCRFCGCPMKPKGIRKKEGEFDHACGCPYHRHSRYCAEMVSRERLFGQLLHAAFMVLACQVPNPRLDLGQTVGEMDWVAEIARLREEIFASAS